MDHLKSRSRLLDEIVERVKAAGPDSEDTLVAYWYYGVLSDDEMATVRARVVKR